MSDSLSAEPRDEPSEAARQARICATTIVSANYLAYAKVLADSVLQHSPEISFFVLIVDRRSEAIEAHVARLGLNAVWAAELGLPDFERLAYQFDILELNTALKPTLLKRLLAKGFAAAIYWDPDIRLYGPPAPITDALDAHSVVLTPHTLAPLMDGKRPSDIDLMRHGAYNLGFIAIKNDPNGRALLDWWEDRCLGHGFLDPVEGIFVDQKWLDLAPGYFDGVHILKHRGCNAAYWNLHERPVRRVAQGLLAAEDPLVFFHFSGVNPRDGGKLSKHQDRYAVDGQSVLTKLIEDYCADVMRAGHAEFADTPYSFGVLSNGQAVSPLMRRALVCGLADEDRPFDAGSRFQQGLKEAGLWPPLSKAPASPKVNAFNFNAGDRRIRLLNRLIRLSWRLLGQARSELLLKYLVFLGRGSNFAAVLTGQPFFLEHRSRSQRLLDRRQDQPLPPP